MKKTLDTSSSITPASPNDSVFKHRIDEDKRHRLEDMVHNYTNSVTHVIRDWIEKDKKERRRR